MNPANILATLSLLETLAQQISTVVSDIKAAQASGGDLTDAQVQGYRDQANAALAKLGADVKPASAAKA